MNRNQVKQLVSRLRGCTSGMEIKAVLNGETSWSQYQTREGSMSRLLDFSESLEFQTVVAHLSRMVSGSGIHLTGDMVSDELQDHFQRNAMQFVPRALSALILLGFIPISWHLDEVTQFPVFEVTDLRISDFHTLRNKLTNAQTTLRLNTELGIYDHMCEIYMVSPPNAFGEIDSHAMRMLPDWELLKMRRREMMRELSRPALYIVQKRPGTNEEESPLDQLLYQAQRRAGLRKRKRDALESMTVEVAGEGVSILQVDEEYEVVGSQYAEQTNQFRNKTASDHHEEMSRLVMRKLFQLLGVSANLFDDVRHEYGNGREASDRDFNKSAGRIARIVGQAIQLALDMCYHVVAMKDPQVQRQMYYEKEARKAEKVLQYLEKNQEGEQFLQSYEQLAEMFDEEIEPDIEQYRKALGSRRPRVEMNPDTRLTPAELEVIRSSTVFNDEETRRLEAQALGMAEKIEEKPAKRQKNLLDASKEEPEEDETDQ